MTSTVKLVCFYFVTAISILIVCIFPFWMGLVCAIFLVWAASHFFGIDDYEQEKEELRPRSPKAVKPAHVKKYRPQPVRKPEKPAPPVERFASIEKRVESAGYIVRQPAQEKPPCFVLDENKLRQLRHQTKIAQGLLAEIFADPPEEQQPRCTAGNTDDLGVLGILLGKQEWTRVEVEGIVGPGVMLGSLLERINDCSYSKIGEAVIEEDGETIYVKTEYKDQLI